MDDEEALFRSNAVLGIGIESSLTGKGSWQRVGGDGRIDSLGRTAASSCLSLDLLDVASCSSCSVTLAIGMKSAPLTRKGPSTILVSL